MRYIQLGLLLTLFASTSLADLLVSRGAAGVDHYTNDGVFLSNLISPGSGGLTDARGVAVAPNGDIFVGDFSLDQILRYDRTGAFLGVFSSDAAIDNPFSLMFGPDGDLYVASAGMMSNVARLDPLTGAILNGDFATGNPVTQPIGGPQYLEWDSANNLMFLTDIAGRLFRYNATTGAWISTSFYVNPEGVALGGDGFLYLAQGGFGNITRIPSLGGASTVVIPDNTFNLQLTDIKFGPSGDLYISADQIYRYDVSGMNGVFVDSFGTGGQFITFFTPVPEPGTYALTCIGLLGALALRRRK